MALSFLRSCGSGALLVLTYGTRFLSCDAFAVEPLSDCIDNKLAAWTNIVDLANKLKGGLNSANIRLNNGEELLGTIREVNTDAGTLTLTFPTGEKKIVRLDAISRIQEIDKTAGMRRDQTPPHGNPVAFKGEKSDPNYQRFRDAYNVESGTYPRDSEYISYRPVPEAAFRIAARVVGIVKNRDGKRTIEVEFPNTNLPRELLSEDQLQTARVSGNSQTQFLSSKPNGNPFAQQNGSTSGRLLKIDDPKVDQRRIQFRRVYNSAVTHGLQGINHDDKLYVEVQVGPIWLLARVVEFDSPPQEGIIPLIVKFEKGDPRPLTAYELMNTRVVDGNSRPRTPF